MALCYPQSGRRRCLACPDARCRCPQCGWLSFVIRDGLSTVTHTSCVCAVELRLYFASIPTFCLFDCLKEGITTLFVFNRTPSHLTMVKFNGPCCQFCVNAAIYPQFLVRVGFRSHSGYNISYTLFDKLSHRISVFVNVIIRGYQESIPVRMIKTVLKCGFPLVRPALNSQ